MRAAFLLALTSLQMLQQILMAALEQQSRGRRVGCEEVKHPQPSSELISYDNRILAFGFYNVFAY